MAQQVKYEDQSPDLQLPQKCWVCVVAHLQSQQMGGRDRGSSLCRDPWSKLVELVSSGFRWDSASYMSKLEWLKQTADRNCWPLHTYSCTHMGICTNVNMYKTHTHTPAQTWGCTHACMHNMHTNMHACTQISILPLGVEAYYLTALSLSPPHLQI